MNRIGVVIIGVIAMLLASCSFFDDINIHGSVVVETEQSAKVTMTSATLYGHINTSYLAQSKEFGFVISKSPDPSIGNGEILFATEVNKKGLFIVPAVGLTTATTYYYRAFIFIDTTYYLGDVKEFTTSPFELSPVDLGLSVMWANANFGASSPEAYGQLFAWGEIWQKDQYSWGTYEWNDGSGINLTKYNQYPEDGLVDNLSSLEQRDDVAFARLGGGWRMPTSVECSELIQTRYSEDYKWEWKEIDGHYGLMVMYLLNGNYIFLPAAGYANDMTVEDENALGYYWSQDLSYTPTHARCFYFNISEADVYGISRFIGCSVRPVCEKDSAVN